ncbi:MAG: sarcosine oxidase subunit alpha [Alphaproteobacteria bacterium]|nr:sarcosine oxidase subunit alpha [Alphaproteobacteria bacterium]
MSGQGFRVKGAGDVDRAAPLKFTFDGRKYEGYRGDTLASALLANGVHLVGRSFKYHRPRGIMSAGSEEPNALIQLGDGHRSEPNIRATRIELRDGLVAESQNRWPSLKFDIGSVNNLLHRFLPSGFYYKTFMWPASWWMKYEHWIRRAAGLGKAPTGRDPDRYEKRHGHVDVLIAGGGPAGLAAALAAGRAGARVLLADEGSEFGGALLADRDQSIDGVPALDWVRGVVAELEAMPEVTLLRRATVTGYYDHNYITVLERVTDHLGDAPDHAPRQRLWKLRAKRMVLAAGAIERPLVFADNDRPGIMLSSAARAYVNRFGVAPGRRVLMFTNNDDAYRTALALKAQGVGVAGIVDVRAKVESELAQAVSDAGITVHAGHAIVATRGSLRVSSVDVMRLTADGATATGMARRIDCDAIAVSGGWTPSVHLFSQSAGKLRWSEEIAAFIPDISVQNELSAGACNGAFSLADCLEQGFTAGGAAAAANGFEAPVIDALAVEEPEIGDRLDLWVVPGRKPLGHAGKHFVDFQNDVTAADVHLAAREGYRSVEHLKRYTTTGMGTDQGKTSNINALAIMGEVLGANVPGVGHTTFRPPYTPSTIGAYAGRNIGDLFDPVRSTAMDAWHREAGAKFEHVGQWMRAWYYPKTGETMRQAVDREVLAARASVGILDATTLGKIDIQGPDAAEFLNRVYTNAWLKLAPGRARYGLMLKEDGMVMDDGVTVRLAEDHFHMTTTTGGAGGVLDWLEEWLQTEWPDLKVFCSSVTEQWAVASICGPKCRELLAELCTDIDLSNEAFPFMSIQTGTVAGIPARVFRISFTGELSFEINVPRRHGLTLWKALMAAGEKYDICPYGTEAMHVLRAEKGFIIVGQETDGTVTPGDLCMDWIVSKKKPDFIGKRALLRPDIVKVDRKRLVGLLTEDPNEVIPEGAQIVERLLPEPPMEMIGHVTSSYYSPNCGRSIAMALVKGGLERMGETLTIPLSGKTIKAVVTEARFFDLEGERADG